VHQTNRATELGVGVVQLVYSRLDREPERAVLASCERQDLGVLAREPLAGGLLSGKYAPGTRFTDPNDTRSHRPAADLQARLEEVERIRRTEVPADAEMATWSLRWCLRTPAVTAVIPGCKSIGQVDANAAAGHAPF
jgi:aryl-alcohol dehydrogenase-like predicted oxidoreductase